MQHDGKYGQVMTVCDHLGWDPSLPGEVERLLKLFLEHCHYIGVPPSRGRCARDIQEMVIQEKIQVWYFVYNKPGTICCRKCTYMEYYQVTICEGIKLWRFRNVQGRHLNNDEML